MGIKIYETVITDSNLKFEALLDKLTEKENEDDMIEIIKTANEIKGLLRELNEKLNEINKSNIEPTNREEILEILSNRKDSSVFKNPYDDDCDENQGILLIKNSVIEDFELDKVISYNESEKSESRIYTYKDMANEKFNVNNADEKNTSEIDILNNIEKKHDQITDAFVVDEITNIQQHSNNLPSTVTISDNTIHSNKDDQNIYSNFQIFPNFFSTRKSTNNNIILDGELNNPQKQLIESSEYIDEEVMDNMNIVFKANTHNKEISFISINMLLKFLLQEKGIYEIDSRLIKSFIMQKSGIIHNNNLIEIMSSVFEKYKNIDLSNNIINNGLGLILVNWIYYRCEDEIYNDKDLKHNIVKILEKLVRRLPNIIINNKTIDLISLINLLKKKDNDSYPTADNYILNSQRYFSIMKMKNFLNLEETFEINEKIMKNQYINNDRILPSDVKEYFDLNQWSEVEIAKQITLITHFIFLSISPKELINSQWTKTNKHKESPNVLKMIDRFNKISLWVCEEILAYDKARHRAQIIEKFIVIANELRKFNNFNDAFAVIIALNSFQIKSLQKSWNKISLERVVIYKDLDELFSYSNNFGSLREEMEKVDNESCIPYLGYFLKNLAFLDEGHKYIKEPNLINVEKIIKVQKILDKIIRYQAYDYRFKPIYKLSFIAEPSPLDEDNLTEISGRLEPFFNLSHKKSNSKRLTNTDLTNLNINSTFKDFLIFYNRFTLESTLREKLMLLNDWD